RIEAERKAEEARKKAEADAQAKAEADRLAAEAKAKAEAERLAKEQEEKARLEAEKKAQEEAARLEAERIAEEQARLEAEKKAQEEAARLEAERLAAEKAKQEALAKAEAERLAKEKAEAERLAQEAKDQVEKARLEEEARIKAEELRKAQEEAARLEAERFAREKAEQEAQNNQNGETETPVKPELPVNPVEEPLVTEKGDPAYHELPAIDIEDFIKELQNAGDLSEKPEKPGDSEAPTSMSGLVAPSTQKTDEVVTPILEAKPTALTAPKSDAALEPVANESSTKLPETGENTSPVLSAFGLGMAGLALIAKRKKRNI
ncbi:LPXTG cell wall anchor domain-containing protein, partial [Streptococcus suis]|nr:LPXTG cell wall anchor domain-containing protein [Streptococcus suis]